MSANMTSSDWWPQELERRERFYAALSADHFAVSTSIPDLEFLTPHCPICSKPTEYDDGHYVCDVCRVSWPRNGYGHVAERWTDD